MILLRNLLFYPLFYGGSALLVMRALVALIANPKELPRVVRRWPMWQRWCLRNIVGIDVRVEGAPLDQQALYALKHESFFEAIDLPLLIDWPVTFAKEELFRIPGWGRAAKHYGIVPVARSRGARALREMFAAANRFGAEGRSFAIFPEGTRVAHGAQPALRSGFAGLYKHLGVQVVPVAVHSGPFYHRWLKRPGTIVIRFMEPIEAGLPRTEIEARTRAGINALNESV